MSEAKEPSTIVQLSLHSRVATLSDRGLWLACWPGFQPAACPVTNAFAAATSGGCQKAVAPFTRRTEQALLLQRNLHQTKELERLILCGRLLREVSPSLLYEVIAAWNLTAANAPKT